MSDRVRSDLREALLDLMRRPEFRPATLPRLAQALRVGRDRRGELRRALRTLLGDREVVRVDGNRYALPRGSGAAGGGAGHPAGVADPGTDAASRRTGGTARSPDGAQRPTHAAARSTHAPAPPGGHDRARPAGATVTGRLERHPRGFGFVRPDEPGPDLFLPARDLGDLLDGDRVAVRIVRHDREGRPVGEIARVLERSRRRVLGIYRSQGGPRGPGTVEAYDRVYANDILIAEGDAGGARNGMVVGVEITRPPLYGRRAGGRIVEVLGRPDEPGMDLRTIIRKYDLREAFPPDVVAEAEGAPEAVTDEDRRGREDFRDLPIVTIDGETAMDFDDAVLVRKNRDGTYELQVHIADVAHYVRPRSALDREAYERGTSVYFPGTALPMLPHRLSNGICSLNPGVDRLVQSVIMAIDRKGAVAAHRFADGVIRSAARMTYTEVARILVDHDAEAIRRRHALVPGFRLMEELCGVLNERRRRRGSIDFDLPEPEVILAATGEMTGITALERNVAHRLIEEFMLVANETVAGHLHRARAPSVYRIHERPDPKKLEEFDAVAQAFGYRLARPFETIEPAAFQAIVDLAKGRPEERFLSRLMLRSMKQARYAPARDLHFGLATTCYTHFTSPIRRYPDLIVHRVLRRVRTGRALGERERQGLQEFLPGAALHSSRTERTADAAENELIEWKKLAFMADRLGEEFDGFIISVHPFGFFVELREFFVDGLVRTEALADDHYRFLERKQILKGDRRGRVFKIGDPVRVRVDRVDQVHLYLDFSIAAGAAAPRRRAGR